MYKQRVMEIKIYCLYDPISCKIRYIGRTSKKILEHRLIEHISKAKYFERYYPGKRCGDLCRLRLSVRKSMQT